MTPGPAFKSNPLINLAAFVILMAGLKEASALVNLLLLSTFIAIICAPPLFWMKRKGIPSLAGIFILMVGIIGIWVFLVSLIGTSLADFSRNVPVYQESLKALTNDAWVWLNAHGISIDKSLLLDTLNPGKILLYSARTLNNLGGVLTNTFFIILAVIFILMEATTIPLKLRAIQEGKEDSLEKYSELTNSVNTYLGIKTITSLVTGILITGLLEIQGLDFAILWGIVAFLLNFIPSIGSIIASVPAILLALVQLGPVQAGVTAAGYVGVNIIIGSIIEPRVMGNSVGLSTFIVFISLAFWGWVLGPVGMLLSVPLTMTLKILLAASESTRWIAILLGGNREIARLAMQQAETPSPEPEKET